MVFGLFEGKMEIMLPKTNFTAGETIEGSLKLSLKKAKQGRALKVVLQAIETRTTTSTSLSGKGPRTTTNTTKVTVFSTETIVDGEKTYSGESNYQFKIQVPNQSFSRQAQMPNDTLGRILTASQAFSGNTRNLKWELKAFLDVPGIDISKTIQISVA